MPKALLVFLTFSTFSLTGNSWPQNPTQDQSSQASESTAYLEDEIVESEHSVLVEGETLHYLSRTGRLILRTEQGRPQASIFFVAYSLETPDSTTRPITFNFNGGPGSSSIWLHLGAFGPRKVLVDEEGFPTRPYRLVDNPYTLLDQTDLVFVDPVSTGYSRAVTGEDPKEFHGVSADMEYLAEFIRLFLTRFQRWDSPRFISGESYGATRAAYLSNYLQQEHGIYLDGVILISAALNFQTIRFDPGNELPYLLFLPAYTATAWYHGKLDSEFDSLEEALESAEEFVGSDYQAALMKGNQFSVEDRKRIAQQMSRLIGIPADYIERSNLRLTNTRFIGEVLANEAKLVGRLDGRFTGVDLDPIAEGYQTDPSYSAIQGPFTETFNHYIRSELGFESDLPYEVLTDRVYPWDYDTAENRYLNVGEDLRRAIQQNPELKVLVASGYYDLATPYFATDYTFSHLGMPQELDDSVTIRYYESGHMIYLHPPSMRQFKSQLADFYDGE